MRCEAVDLYCLRERATEELQRLQSDTVNALQYFVSLHDQLSRAADLDDISAGLRALLLRKAHIARRSLAALWAVGQPMLTASCDQTLYDRCVTLCSTVSEPAVGVQVADCNDVLSDQSDAESTDSGEDE